MLSDLARENLSFPASWFEPEVREGFYVTGMMKRYWAAQLKVLSEIATVCERHGLRWFAHCGTLLGAVRHGGYIPWDDDLDICMLREDWLAFEEHAHEELPEGYFVKSIRTEPEQNSILMRVVNSPNIELSEEHLREFYGCPYSVGVDIFPLDGIYEDESRENDRRIRLKMIERAVDLLAEGMLDTDVYRDVISEIERQNQVQLQHVPNIVTELLQLSERIYAEVPTEGASHVVLMNYWLSERSHKYPVEHFRDTLQMPFENIEMPVPARYDGVLKTEYGNYVSTYKGGGVHEYPCYGRQEAIIRERMGQNAWRYTFDREAFEIVRAQKRPSLIQQCFEKLDILSKAHTMLDRLIAGGQNEQAGMLLEQCQALAISAGTDLEKKTGEDAPVIHMLERYCEELYQSAGDWQGSEPLEKVVCRIRQIICGDEASGSENESEILFLPCRPRGWRSMEELWRGMTALGKTCHVMCIPYRERKPDGDLGAVEPVEMDFSPDVCVLDICSYDWTKRHPDMILTDQPYDGWNLAGSVEEFYFSDNLRKYTDKLVYVTPKELDAPASTEDKAATAIAELVEQPALIYADEVIVWDDKMRDYYITRLAELVGEDCRSYLESKVVTAAKYMPVSEAIKTDALLPMPGAEKTAPTLLFHTTISFLLEYREHAISSIRRALDTVIHEQRIECIWYIDKTVDYLKDMDVHLWQMLQDVREEYQVSRIKINIRIQAVEDLINVCDAFYGNCGRLAYLCRLYGKPVMIQSAD